MRIKHWKQVFIEDENGNVLFGGGQTGTSSSTFSAIVDKYTSSVYNIGGMWFAHEPTRKMPRRIESLGVYISGTWREA